MGTDQKPPGQPPQQQQPRKPAPSPQRQAQGGAPKALPPRRKSAEPRDRNKEIVMMPFVFLFFVFGLINILATPVVYTYEIITYNKNDVWPAWSGIDGLNYLFKDLHLQIYKDILYHGNPPLPVIAHHDNFLNDVIAGYLDLSVVFLCLLQGIIFLTLSIRTSIMILGK